MKHLFVWVRRADGSIMLAGELACTDPVAGGQFESEFEYSAQWLNDANRFSLDPASLPLAPLGRRFQAMQLHPPLAVFDDALPDDWGRRLLSAAIKFDGGKPSPPVMLLQMRGGCNCPTRAEALDIAAAWGIPDPAHTIDQVIKAVDGFDVLAQKLAVRGARSLQGILEDVHRRLDRLR